MENPPPDLSSHPAPLRLSPARLFQIHRLLIISVLGMIFLLTSPAAEGQFYAGGMFGISTLSGDSRSVLTPGYTAFASYSPQNGLVLNGFVGKHLSDYFTLQADYVWNRNSLTFSASTFHPISVAAYEETRQNSEQSGFASVLVYFRRRTSWIRPYLSVGTGFAHLSSTQRNITTLEHAPSLPPPEFSSNMIALRVPVGMDVRLHTRWYFRYSFAETLSRNPISDELSPPGSHSLKNFQNLFGIVHQF